MARIYSVYSSKGGIGKSFVAISLAWCLRHEAHAEVLLIDAKQPVSTGVEALLGERFDGALSDDYKRQESMQDVSFQSLPIIKWAEIDVLKLSSIDSPWVATEESLVWLQNFLQFADHQYQYVIIDTGGHLDASLLAMLDFSDIVLLLTSGDPVTLRTTTDDVTLFQKLNFHKGMIKIVMNRWDAKESIDTEWVSSRLTMDLYAVIPQAKDGLFIFDAKSKAKQKEITDLRSAFLDLMLNLVHDKSPAIRRRDLDLNELELAEKQARTSRANQAGKNGFIDKNYRQLKVTIHEKLLEILDLKRMDAEVENDPEKLKELENVIKDNTRALLDKHSDIRDRALRDRLTDEIIKDVLYLGPLEYLLSDDDISEIMVNRWNTVYVERLGRIVKSEAQFLSEKQLQRIIERIVASVGRRVDMSSPMVDARLKDGSRVNAIIPPLASSGAVLTIRKFSRDVLTVDELIKYGTLNQPISEFLRAAVISRQNIIVSGGTGTGKTTLLNVLSSNIPSNERIITIEDSAELQLRQPHVVILEGRPPNVEGKGEVTIRDLVKNSLRMRPDRIVVGECRSGEALDMLQAMNTGHDGSMTTIHANSSGEMLTRLETLVMFSGFKLPSRAIREQIASAVDLVIQLERLKDGSRKIVQVSEVLGMRDEKIIFEDIFQYKQTGMDMYDQISGDTISTGYTPKCLERFEAFGLSIPKEMFWAA